MKGSAIVQGLKSWASALHPQLPLSRRESQRLLTALTSSFRRQLDEEHPPHGHSDGRPQLDKNGDVGVKAGRSQGLHSSSAAYAHRHLQSVLTNPLLAQGKVAKPDAATVTAELEKNPDKDSIALLEEFQEKGHATVPVAVACLQEFHKSIGLLPVQKRKAAIVHTSAGKRTLLWLWQNRIHEDEQFVSDRTLSDLVVSLVEEEGHERYLWDWLQLDLATFERVSTPLEDKDRMKELRYPHRWRGVIARSIVLAKMKSKPSYGPSSLDAAMEALFKAMELPNSSLIPLSPSFRTISNDVRYEYERRPSTSPKLYDRFLVAARSPQLFGRVGLVTEYGACWLELRHPTAPTPLPALALLKSVFHPPVQARDAESFKKYIRGAKTQGSQHTFSYFLTDTVLQLEDLGRDKDAAWITAVAKDFNPSLAASFDYNVRQRRDRWRTLNSNVRSGTSKRSTTASRTESHMMPAQPSFAI